MRILPQELVVLENTCRNVRSVRGCRSHHEQLVVSLKHLQECSQCSEAGGEGGGTGGGAGTPTTIGLVLKTPAEMFAVFRVEGTDITTMGLVLENTNANVRSVQKREERVEVQVHPQ